MAHTIAGKQKLLGRIQKIRGQVGAIERAMKEDEDCSSILHTVAATRGALNGLMAELMEDHVREHVMPEKAKGEPARAAEQLIAVINSYLK